ncbi:alkaline phosphatase D family protein [Corallococcus aberystwythensis]|uniref:alkaline phosphatase D family protein n=1 Tax=Corallococcus aberystwythensis TaxID=2316722 RepID=UPI001315AD0F|nr:alkaline phosphatase D family protein [Corallococcus aberystwythensis]
MVEDVVVPAKGASPNIAFFSCNGTEKVMDPKNRSKAFVLWERMLEEHQGKAGRSRKPSGFQLLIGGGDQIYADSLWKTMDEMRCLEGIPDTLDEPVPEGFAERVMAEYVDLYRERWNGRQGIAPMLARVPGLFTWDDHDIFDGWGSQEASQETQWFTDIYSAAARAFEAFQLGRLEDPQTARRPDDRTCAPGEKRHYLQTMTFASEQCDLDVVMLDLRSGRTSGSADEVGYTVMSKSQWEAFDDWRAACCARKVGKAYRAHHILVVSSIPIVHLRFSTTLERMAGRFSDERDDMLDQWESMVHRGERNRLIMDLFSLAKRSEASVTVLSGDVHVAARGRMRSSNREHLTEAQYVAGETFIEQLTSSAISNMPPNIFQFLGILMASKDSIEDLPGFIQTQMLPVGRDLYLRERNWLALRVEPSRLDPPQPKLWARWVAEKSPLSMEVVVAPSPPPPPTRLP